MNSTRPRIDWPTLAVGLCLVVTGLAVIVGAL